MTRSVGWVPVAILIGGLLVPVASADHIKVSDGRDTRGLLDVKSVELRPTNPPVWRIETFKGWTVERIFDRGYFVIRFDTLGNDRTDYYVLLRSNRYRMLASLWRDRLRRRDRKIATLFAHKVDRSTLEVFVPLDKIAFERDSYLWSVRSLMTGPLCPRVCIDAVPDSDGISETAPGATPSPPPSPFEPDPEPSESPTPAPSFTPEPRPSPTAPPSPEPTETPTPTPSPTG